MTKLLTVDDLDRVTGGNGWDALDKGVSKVWAGWNDRTCVTRQGYVGWGIGTVTGFGTAALWPLLGPWGPALVGPPVGLASTAVTSSYFENCHKKTGK